MSRLDRPRIIYGGLILAMAVVTTLLCGCHQQPAPRPTDYPAPLDDQTLYPRVCFVPPVVKSFTWGRSADSAKSKTTNADGCAGIYGSAGYNYTIWAKAEGYKPVAYSFAMSGAKITIRLEPDAAPTNTRRPTDEPNTETPTPPPTIPPVPTATKTVTKLPTIPGPTATPWADLPAWAVGILSWDAQQAAGVDWADAPVLWAYAREHAHIPSGLVHIATINGVEVKWVTCGEIVLAEANGKVYEVPFWASTPTATPTITQTPIPTDTPTATTIPTIPTIPPTPTSEPAPYATVVPAIYKMFDYGTDYQTTNPELGPVGSVHWAPWSLVNPAPGVYNWDYIDTRLESERGLTVTLSTGEIVPKPILAQVIAYTSDAGNPAYIDWTPDWLGDSYTLTSGELSAVVPRYDAPEWRLAYWDMVRAFGARYNNDPQITAVVVTTGLDGETTPTKDGDANWETVILDQQLPGVRYRFTQFVEQTMAVYHEAFPSKQLYINNAPGGMRMTTSEQAAQYDPPIGLKHSGMWTDLDSHDGYGDFVGSWDHIAAYSDTLSIWLESPFGLGDDEDRLWSLYAGLHYHPDAISVHPEYLGIDSAHLRWASAHCGVTIENTPSVWTVMRDWEYPKVNWGSGGTSGKMGDWTFWLYRDGDAPRVEDVDDTVYGRQARRITDPVRFWCATGFEMQSVELTVKCQGQTISIEDGATIQNVTVENDGQWRVVSFGVATCAEFYIENAGYTHKVEAYREPLIEPAPEKLWTMMIYMAGDNNLGYYFGRAIGYLEMLLPLDNTNVIVMIDGPDQALAYYIVPQSDGPYTDLVNSWDLGEVNTGDPATLRDFVTWAQARFPSEYTYLSVADHGRGTHGIAYDDNSYKDTLTPTELRQALTGQHIDVLHADACLMGMIENGYQVKEVADYYVAYENLGWSVFAYDQYAAIADAGATPAQLAVGIVEAYHNHDSLKGDPRTSSVVDLSKIGPVIDRLNDLVDVLRVTDRETVLLGRKWAQRFDTQDYFYLTPADEYIDLYDFALELYRHTESANLKAACQALTAAIDDYVLVSHAQGGMMYGPGYSAYVELREAQGVAIYFPQNSGALEFDEYVGGGLFTFTEASQWDDYLAEFYFAGAEDSRSVVIEDRDPPPMLEAE